jgi:hypothetical protein
MSVVLFCCACYQPDALSRDPMAFKQKIRLQRGEVDDADVEEWEEVDEEVDEEAMSSASASVSASASASASSPSSAATAAP